MEPHECDEVSAEGDPLRMAQELQVLQIASKDLIRALGESSVPLGYRRSNGAKIHELMQRVLKINGNLKILKTKVDEHQERQCVVRFHVDAVCSAENTIDTLVRQLQDIEEELSLLLHRTKVTQLTKITGGLRCDNESDLSVEDVISYSCHCSFTTSCGIRWFFPDGRPMHPPDQRDPRFLLPFPPAHSMRLEGGLWDHRSSRKPEPPSDQAAVAAGGPGEAGESPATEPAKRRPPEEDVGAPSPKRPAASAAEPQTGPRADGQDRAERREAAAPSPSSSSSEEEEEEEFVMDLNPDGPEAQSLPAADRSESDGGDAPGMGGLACGDGGDDGVGTEESAKAGGEDGTSGDVRGEDGGDDVKDSEQGDGDGTMASDVDDGNGDGGGNTRGDGDAVEAGEGHESSSDEDNLEDEWE